MVSMGGDFVLSWSEGEGRLFARDERWWLHRSRSWLWRDWGRRNVRVLWGRWNFHSLTWRRGGRLFRRSRRCGRNQWFINSGVNTRQSEMILVLCCDTNHDFTSGG